MATRRAESGWLFLHDGMPDHPKIEELSDRAFRALVILWCYCSRHLTDGYVSETAWLKRTTVKIRRELIESGLVDTDGEGSNAFPVDFHQKSFEKGVVMHDYLDWQRSAAEATEFASKKADAGSLGNHQRWHVTAGRRSDDCKFCVDEGPPEGSQPGSQMRSQVGSHPGSHPDRGSDRKTVAEKIREDKNKTTARQQPRSLASLAEVDNPPDRFDEFWTAYPRKVAKQPAVKAWKAALKRGEDPAHVIAVARRYATEKANSDPRHIAHASTWLNGCRYDDPIEPLRLVAGDYRPYQDPADPSVYDEPFFPTDHREA